ncbi:hypothetical protein RCSIMONEHASTD_6 [Rhodobacter phage RcSimone-Hastad]|nr:hypothetical protein RCSIMONEHASTD_6 [Rhodobacter phage RcSimone-Hastad]
MADTVNLIMPLMSAAQSQKHLTHNDAILTLDTLVQLSVLSANLTAPPGSPAEGSRYIIGSAATGAWAGKDLNVTSYLNGVWVFFPPRKGWIAYNEADNSILVWTGSAWTDLASAGGYVTPGGTNDFSGSNTFTDSLFTLRDNTTPTKLLRFELSGLAAGTNVLTVPAGAAQTLVTDNTTQTISGAKTFSGTFVVSAATSSLGTATAASTVNVGTGANASGVSKSINVGTGGASGSTTTLVFGSATSGARGTATFNSPTITFSALNTAINISGTTALAGPSTTATFLYLGLGGASPDATNRFSINTPAVLLNNAGAGINATVNKNAAGDDASFTFQTGFSTRALFGLLADDHFSVKVSPNGSSFFTGLNIRNADGHVGVGGATADANNGLSVAGNVLFNRDSTSINATLNKQAAANDASFTFQTNFSTRALFGTLASDDFTVKVSPNGSTFYDGMVIDRNTGIARFPNTTPQVDEFNTAGTTTWTKPAWANRFVVMLVGGGGGGGSGASGDNTAVRAGGGGGGAGAVSVWEFTADEYSATCTVIVGAGGTSGAAVSSGNGTVGGAGGTSEFRLNGSATGNRAIIASGGSGGGGGSTTGTAGAGGVTGTHGGSSNAGGAGGTASNAGAGVATTLAFAPGGGGGGGGKSTTPAVTNAGAGGIGYSVGSTGRQSAGGTAGGAGLGGNGGSNKAFARGAGGGGGGGGSHLTNAGGAGGNGGNPGGGGGGGGAALNTAASGAGGVGGVGMAVIISYAI